MATRHKDVKNKNVLLFLTDAAPHRLKVSGNVAETVRLQFPLVY